MDRSFQYFHPSIQSPISSLSNHINCMKAIACFILFSIFFNPLSDAQVFKKKEKENAETEKASENKCVGKCDGLPLEKRSMLAVLDFETLPGMDANAAHLLSLKLENALFNTNCFRLVERKKLNYLAEEQKIDQSSVKKLGSLLGAQAAVFGIVTKYEEKAKAVVLDARFEFTLRIVNTITGELITSTEVSGKNLGANVIWKPNDPKYPEVKLSEPMNKAIEKAFEDAISAVCEKSEVISQISTPPPAFLLSFTLNKVTSEDFKKTRDFFKNSSDVIQVIKPAFGNGTVTATAFHKIDPFDFADKFVANMKSNGVQFNIKSQTEEEIIMDKK